jgi:DNA mismatch repair protein MLH1
MTYAYIESYLRMLQVHFMNEDVIVEAISDAIQGKLAVQSSQRTFVYQTLTPVTDPSGSSGFPKGIASARGKSKNRVSQTAASDDEHEATPRIG